MPHKRTQTGQEKQQQRIKLYDTQKERRFFLKKKETDVANAIVKECSHRDPVTGDIFFNAKSTKIMKTILEKTEFRFEEEDNIQPSPDLMKHVKVRSHYEWYKIGGKTIGNALKHQDNEVLNRGIEPCWWLNEKPIDKF